MPFRFLAAVSSLVLAGAAGAQTFSADRIRSDVSFLADDLLEGRGTGTRGYDLAARYVASRYEGLGLKPGGDKGWYQGISFATASWTRRGRSAVTMAAGDLRPATMPLSARRLPPPTSMLAKRPSSSAMAWRARNSGSTIIAGSTSRAKLSFICRGTPEGLPSEIASTLNEKKSELAVSKGAVGALPIATPRILEIFPWPKILANTTLPRMRYVHPDGHVQDPTAALRSARSSTRPRPRNCSRAPPRRQAGGGVRRQEGAAEWVCAETAGPDRAVQQGRSRSKRQCAGTARRLGSDAQERSRDAERPPRPSRHHPGRKGDAIANGAMDNAAGVATMLEAARAFVDSGERPKRSYAVRRPDRRGKGPARIGISVQISGPGGNQAGRQRQSRRTADDL